MDLEKLNRKTLKELPDRAWDVTTRYDSICLVPSGLKHDSGYMMIAIVGIIDRKAVEVCAYPDDICWNFTDYKQDYDISGVRTDCFYPSGVMRFWARNTSFEVECALSSTTVKLINK